MFPFLGVVFGHANEAISHNTGAKILSTRAFELVNRLGFPVKCNGMIIIAK